MRLLRHFWCLHVRCTMFMELHLKMCPNFNVKFKVDQRYTLNLTPFMFGVRIIHECKPATDLA